MANEQIVKNVISRIRGSIDLDTAKELMDKVEKYAKEKGMSCVVAVCDAHGNPVAVHVMDDAFLVSYQVASQKAYTAVAVKMSTKELNALVQPGGTFYGLESLKDGRIVAFGGGVPLKIGGVIVGGLGVSGGTGEEDDEIARYGLQAFLEKTGQL